MNYITSSYNTEPMIMAKPQIVATSSAASGNLERVTRFRLHTTTVPVVLDGRPTMRAASRIVECVAHQVRNDT